MRGHALIWIVLAACADVAQPYDLDHARVMAVRIDPPAIAGGERAHIDVLVTDAESGPRVAPASEVTVTAPAGIPIAIDDGGWYVDAPAGVELVIPLAIVAAVAGESLPAQKTLELGRHGANPAAPAVLHDGVGGDLVFEAAGDVSLTPDPMPVAGDDSLSYRWFSSVGSILGYTRPAARLSLSSGARGVVGVVVRDQAGGTAWSFVAAEVGR